MRAVAQRVARGARSRGGEEVARMREGLLALVGVAADDTRERRATSSRASWCTLRVVPGRRRAA